MASIFQSALMKNLEPQCAEALHSNTLHPYSQYLRVEGEDIYWTVNALNSEASEIFIDALCSAKFQKVHLDAREEDLPVMERAVNQMSYDDLIQKFYFGEGEPLLHLKFPIPVSFKSEGHYCIFPTPKLIFQNLMMRYDASSESSTVYSEELLADFEKYAEIIRYRLKSTVFYISGAKIPSFMGEITIAVRGSRQLANMARLLAEFGKYSGVGIKTGMGMGALQVMERARLLDGKSKDERGEVIG